MMDGDGEFRTAHSEDQSREISIANAPPILQAEVELPKIMASLGLDENGASPTTEDVIFPPSNTLTLRRSQRKQAVPRIVVGGVRKKRVAKCKMQLMNTDTDSDDFLESDEKIIEFYKNYNKAKVQKTITLETIYEEPKVKNGTEVLTGQKRRRYVTPRDLREVKRLRKQSRVNLLLLQSGTKHKKDHFTIEDVKERLAQSGLVNLSAH